MSTKANLSKLIDKWIEETQNGNAPLDLYVSNSLVDNMASAAWAVLQESQATQEYLKAEGQLKE